MKKIILPIIVLLLIPGSYFGYQWYSSYRQEQMLNGSRDVLIVNEDSKTYSYTSLLDQDDIDELEGFKVVGYADELDLDELQLIESSYKLINKQAAQAAPKSKTKIIDGNITEGWRLLVAQLSEPQVEACNNQFVADMVEFCTVQHVILNSMKASRDPVVCDDIPVDSLVKTCREALNGQESLGFVDENSDGVIDHFSLQAQQFTNN